MGKTTIFQLLSGEHRICFGKASIKNTNLKCNTRGSYDYVGYCPQFDGLWDDLTVRETLRFFCFLRGASFKRASRMATNFGLYGHFRRKVVKLSEGHKQTLSIVIALIGSPSVIFVDVATACLDTNAKNTLWTILIERRDKGKTILLASDCMDEYRTVCTRLIVANGIDVVMEEPEPVSIELVIESFVTENV